MGCCCYRVLEPGWEFAALLAPFCRDDLDSCPGFAIWGMFYIPDDWKQASGSHSDLQQVLPLSGLQLLEAAATTHPALTVQAVGQDFCAIFSPSLGFMRLV